MFSSLKRSFRKRKLLSHSLILIIFGTLLILFFSFVRPLYGLNLKIIDQLHLSENPSPNIVIIGIDDETLDTYGLWSDWSRNLHIQAIENLKSAGTRVIGFDVLFSDSSSQDVNLADSMNNAGNIVLPVIGIEYQPSSSPVKTFNDILSPVSELETASINLGHANISPDSDGTVRRIPLVIRDTGGDTYPAFGLAVLHPVFSMSLPEEYPRQNGALHLLARDIPVDTNYNFRIDFSPDDTDRPYISYGDVIRGDFDTSLVENKIVLIGITATGERDKWIVPGSTDKIPGVFIHAAVIDNILNQRFLTEVGTPGNLVIMMILLVILGMTLPNLGLRWGGVEAAILLAGYLLISFFCFENGYILDMLYPLLLIPAGYVGNVIIQNTATLIENSRLHQEVTEGYNSTIRALAASIDAKDHYTRGHSQRVTEYTLLAATLLNMSKEDIKILEYAGILHDIGKIGISNEILGKPGPLDDKEMALIRQHPVIGANIIEDVPFLSETREIILHHHERYDGTGYPDGLSGEDIPLGARLIAVADAFDSMTSDRAYRAAIRDEDALEEIRNCSGTQLCPVAVEAFVSAVLSYLEYAENKGASE